MKTTYKPFVAFFTSNDHVIVLDNENQHFEELGRDWENGETVEEFKERAEGRVERLNKSTGDLIPIK